MSSVVIGLKYSRSMIGIRKGDNVNDKEQIIEGLVCVRDDIVNGIVRTGPETYEARFIENAIQYINDITKERDQLKYDITDYQYLLETCRKEKKVLLDKYNHERGQYAYDTIDGDIWSCRP